MSLWAVIGLEALINKEAEVAVLSRAPLDSEREAAKSVGVDISLYPFALDGIAIVVHRGRTTGVQAINSSRALLMSRRSMRAWSR